MGKVKKKLFRGFPDWRCLECSQNWKGVCRAYEPASSQEEFDHRQTGKVECRVLQTPNEMCPPYVVRMSREDLDREPELADSPTSASVPPPEPPNVEVSSGSPLEGG